MHHLSLKKQLMHRRERSVSKEIEDFSHCLYLHLLILCRVIQHFFFTGLVAALAWPAVIYTAVQVCFKGLNSSFPEALGQKPHSSGEVGEESATASLTDKVFTTLP